MGSRSQLYRWSSFSALEVEALNNTSMLFGIHSLGGALVRDLRKPMSTCLADMCFRPVMRCCPAEIMRAAKYGRRTSVQGNIISRRGLGPNRPNGVSGVTSSRSQARVDPRMKPEWIRVDRRAKGWEILLGVEPGSPPTSSRVECSDS